jgi:hypothetical protein
MKNLLMRHDVIKMQRTMPGTIVLELRVLGLRMSLYLV